MATAGPYSGNDGAVYAGANVVAKITRWNFNETVGVRDQGAMGDEWAQNKAGKKQVQGSCACWYDRNDTTGQEALLIGTEITLNLRSGSNTDDAVTAIVALITGRQVTSDHSDQTQTIEIEFVGGSGSAVVTHGVVS